MILCAVKKEELDIPLPIKLGGFGSRKDYTSKIHDPLEIGLILFKYYKHYLALITLDILGLYNGSHKLITERIQKSISLDNIDIIITCSHSHAAPQLGRSENYQNQDLFVLEICNKAISLIENAKNELVPCLISFSCKFIDYLGGNRDNPNIHRDVYVKALNIVSKTKHAIITNINCHPTVMSASNYEISSEFPGAMKRYVDDHLNAHCLFTQGSCGDISTRFYKRSSTFDEVNRLGKMLGEEIINSIFNLLPLTYVNFQEFNVDLQAKEYLSIFEYDNLITELKNKYEACNDNTKRILETELIGLQKEKDSSKSRKISSYSIKYGILNINDALLVLHPFELYTTLEKKIHDHFPSKNIWSIGYCFDCIGYLLDQENYENNCYEKYSSVFSKDAGEIFINDVISKLADIIERRKI